jgi:hypothetical protein
VNTQSYGTLDMYMMNLVGDPRLGRLRYESLSSSIGKGLTLRSSTWTFGQISPGWQGKVSLTSSTWRDIQYVPGSSGTSTLTLAGSTSLQDTLIDFTFGSGNTIYFASSGSTTLTNVTMQLGNWWSTPFFLLSYHQLVCARFLPPQIRSFLTSIYSVMCRVWKHRRSIQHVSMVVARH